MGNVQPAETDGKGGAAQAVPPPPRTLPVKWAFWKFKPHGWAFWTSMGVLCLAAAAVFAWAWFEWQSKGQTVTGTTMILGLTATVAVGIERLIELFWTFVNQTNSAWWPMDVVEKRIAALQTELNTELSGLVAVAKAKCIQSEGVADELDTALTETLRLWQAAKTNQYLIAASSQTVAHMNWVESVAGKGAKDTDFKQVWAGAKGALKALNGFVGSFTDNPARRVISMFIGMFVGLLVAGIVGIDGVDAALGRGPAAWGVIATGLLVGLGSSPTHEVITALQEYKTSKQVQA